MARTTDYTTTRSDPDPETKPETTETKPEETKPEETTSLGFTGAELRGVLKLIPPVDNRTDDDPIKSVREKLVAAVEKLDAARPKENTAG